jgi:hypothetical protein
MGQYGIKWLNLGIYGKIILSHGSIKEKSAPLCIFFAEPGYSGKGQKGLAAARPITLIICNLKILLFYGHFSAKLA